MATTMAKKERLEHVITARLTKAERDQIENVIAPRESLGDFVREAVANEIKRRKRALRTKKNQ